MNALSELNSMSRWLDVLGSIDNKVNALPRCVTFADISCDMDYKMVIGEMGTTNNIPKLKFFKGISMINEIILPDIPTGVVSYYSNESLPRSPPVVAVSMCSCVYIYKNMKLFYKFYIPPLDVSSLEVEIWRKLIDAQYGNEENFAKIVEKLNDVPFFQLTSPSQHLLSLSPDKYLSFAREYLDFPIQKNSVITCMTTLNMNSIEKDSVACLLLGTENGDIIFLDPQTFSIIHQARANNFKSTPVYLEASGLYDVDYRVFVATREGSICLLRREWLEGKCLIQLSSLIVDILIMPGDSSIVVATMDKTLQSYTKKGKKTWSLNLPYSVLTIALVQLAHLGMNLIAVAMMGGFIHIYNGKNIVDTITTQETISIMRFGQLGQEENVLALITVEGALILKILKRTADFNTSVSGNSQKFHPSYSAAQQARPLLVPKKSKIFLEQAAREREHGIEMHEIFQRELCEMRLYVAKATIESIQSINNSINIGAQQPLKLTARVEGLGPIFKIHISIENLSAESPVNNLDLLFNTDNRHYKVSMPHISVPMIVAGSPYTFMSKVTEIFNFFNGQVTPEKLIDEYLESERPPIKIILLKKGNVQPLLAASVTIPPTDPLMIPFN